MAWWMWALLGFGLAACEMLTPGGFYFLFFGVGALATSALVWLEVGGPAWFQWFLFTAISIICLVPLRGRFVRWATAGETRDVDTLVGQETLLLEDITPGNPGKGELRWHVEIPDLLRFGISVATIALALAYAHIPFLQKFRFVLAWFAQGIGIVNEMVDWLILPCKGIFNLIVGLFMRPAITQPAE